MKRRSMWMDTDGFFGCAVQGGKRKPRQTLYTAKCIDDVGMAGLTKGKNYDVIIKEDDMVTIVDDNGKTVEVFAERFKVKSVTNTARDDVHPEWLFGGAPHAIESQEARGQQELVESEILPTKCPPELKAKLSAAGVKFLAEVPGDPMFINVTLPKGWKKAASDHSMWSNLLDDKGKKVASIFYKAAYYDRDAFMGNP